MLLAFFSFGEIVFMLSLLSLGDKRLCSLSDRFWCLSNRWGRCGERRGDEQ